ncbi:MAG: hypothetical protein FWE40_05280 [Oscillospiraceae bacterium]|nr:hypothetical protein [Oscillospiraceae bacterium]
MNNKTWSPTPTEQSMLIFMEEHEPQLLAELKAEGTLQEHLREHARWHHDTVDRIAEQMGGGANAEACAREAVRGMVFEGRLPYE